MRVEFDNLAHKNYADLSKVASQVKGARRDTSHIEREHPFPAEGYSSWPRAFRRLGAASDNARNPQNHLLAFLLRDAEAGSVAGIVTVEKRQPTPGHLDDPNALEFSYWHRDYEPDQAVKLGVLVVNRLTQYKSQVPGVTHAHNAWMVTLQGDEIKAEVCRQTHFLPVGPDGNPGPDVGPEVYKIDDGVDEPRQLWVRTLA